MISILFELLFAYLGPPLDSPSFEWDSAIPQCADADAMRPVVEAMLSRPLDAWPDVRIHGGIFELDDGFLAVVSVDGPHVAPQNILKLIEGHDEQLCRDAATLMATPIEPIWGVYPAEPEPDDTSTDDTSTDDSSTDDASPDDPTDDSSTDDSSTDDSSTDDSSTDDSSTDETGPAPRPAVRPFLGAMASFVAGVYDAPSLGAAAQVGVEIGKVARLGLSVDVGRGVYGSIEVPPIDTDRPRPTLDLEVLSWLLGLHTCAAWSNKAIPLVEFGGCVVAAAGAIHGRERVDGEPVIEGVRQRFDDRPRAWMILGLDGVIGAPIVRDRLFLQLGVGPSVVVVRPTNIEVRNLDGADAITPADETRQFPVVLGRFWLGIEARF